MGIFRKLAWFFKKEWKIFTAGVLTLIAVSIVNVFPPRMIGLVVDQIDKHTLTMPHLWLYLGIFLLCVVAQYIMRYMWRRFIFGGSVILEKTLRRQLFQHFLKMDQTFYQKHRIGDLMAHATNDIDAVRDVAGAGILMLADSLATGVTTIVAMAMFVDWRLTILAILPLPLLAVMATVLGNKIHNAFEKAQAAFSDLNNKTQESILGVKVIKTLGQASSSSSSSSKDEHKSSSSQQKQESKKDENKKDENKEVQNALPQLESQLGHTLNNGQCYGLTAWYVQQLGGPQLMGSGKSFAQDIGTDYDWSAYGWSVKQYPSIQDIKPGDVINWEAGGALSPGIYGHTGVVVSIDDKGNMTTIEQNAEQGQVAAKYNRTFDQTRIKSVVHKDATSSKTTDKSEAQTTTQNDASKDQAQKQNNNQTQNQTNGLSAADAQAKEWIAARESGGSYTAQNGQYYGRYQLTSSYLNGDFSPANQERVADQYVASRYGSWSNAQSFWLANGWY